MIKHFPTVETTWKDRDFVEVCPGAECARDYARKALNSVIQA